MIALAQNAHVKLFQPRLILCDPTDGSPPGSSVHGLLQARILQWVPISFSRDCPDPGREPTSPSAPAPAGVSFPRRARGALERPQRCGSAPQSHPASDRDPRGRSAPGFLALHLLLDFALARALNRWYQPAISSSAALFSSCPQHQGSFQ